VVISKLVPSEYAPEAANCWVSPIGMLGLIGVTDMEDSAAEVTVRAVFSDLPPKVAVMVGVPGVAAVARPLRSTVADASEALHVTSVVISELVPSEYTPEAANCWVSPTGMFGWSGVTDIKDSVAEVTVSVVFPALPPKEAVIVVEPVATAVARPVFLLTVATDVIDELQVA
jgi:hypothetical protein